MDRPGRQCVEDDREFSNNLNTPDQQLTTETADVKDISIDESGTDHFLRSVLQCPYCREYVAPKLYLCSKGNLSCIRCKVCFCEDNPKHDKREFNMERCFILEKIYDLIPFPCKYRSIGCRIVSFGSQIKNHEKNCTYDLFFRCPLRSKICTESVYTKNDLKKHLSEDHKDRNLPTGELMSFSLEKNMHYTYFLLQFNEIFICFIEKTEEALRFSVRRLARDVREDRTYLYEFRLLFSNKGYLALKMECMTISTDAFPFGKHDHEFTKQYLKLYCRDTLRFVVHCGVRYNY